VETKSLHDAMSSTINQINLKMKKLSIAKGIALFILFFSVNTTSAQTPQMEPIPAIDLGQTIEITPTDPLWEPFWQVSSESREAGQVDLNNGVDPCNKVTCRNGVCCQTVHWYDFQCGCWRFLTTCWAESDGRILLKVAMRQD
jgi:hypothetical protein